MTREKTVALAAIGAYIVLLWIWAEIDSWRRRRQLRNRPRPIDSPPSRAWLYGPFDQETTR